MYIKIMTVKKKMQLLNIGFLLWILFIVTPTDAKVQFKVKCTEETMTVELIKTDDMLEIYLENLKHYPEPACHPKVEGSLATFNLSLTDVFQCGVTRLTNKATGVRSYYHKIIVESENMKQMLSVKCILFPSNHTVVRRNVLPAGFQEPDDLEITTTFTQRAPEPKLGVGVRQGGQLLTGELNVNSGTPLQMEIFLDKNSAAIYGLLVSYMQVTDTKKQEEVIIFNGCSMDPYLFENFNTVDGDFLSAKFRAFKFPESTYVQFKGTVNVCLDKCKGVECSNGQIGYGRRKREVGTMPPDPNKVFEMTITSFIKVNTKGDNLLEKVKLDTGLDPLKSVPATRSNDVGNNGPQQHLTLDTEEIREDLMYTTSIDGKNSATCNLVPFITILSTTFINVLLLTINH
ncbi:zona pelucida superfamily protein qsm [Lycorma delicatula]|uniref:zona pelucida superfamily protein qsm n=1 Tax=Lycorma delicatula TaxID=130591 RepID=UPI003F5185F9